MFSVFCKGHQRHEADVTLVTIVQQILYIASSTPGKSKAKCPRLCTLVLVHRLSSQETEMLYHDVNFRPAASEEPKRMKDRGCSGSIGSSGMHADFLPDDLAGCGAGGVVSNAMSVGVMVVRRGSVDQTGIPAPSLNDTDDDERREDGLELHNEREEQVGTCAALTEEANVHQRDYAQEYSGFHDYGIHADEPLADIHGEHSRDLWSEVQQSSKERSGNHDVERHGQFNGRRVL